MTVASGVGSMPGDDASAYDEAVRIVLGELPDLPHLPELPGRGAGATMTGRALAVITDLAADLQPAGWRLTDAEGIDQRRARSLLAQDLDTVEEQARGYTGRFKTQVAGPWTLAATVERPRGDRVLADFGARRDLAQALAESLKGHVADLRRRLPDAELLVQIDEPALPAVLAGQVPTASGLHKHRTVDAPAASEALEWVFGAVQEAGAVPIAHCCGTEPPIALLLGAGARGISVDQSTLGLQGYDALAEAFETGHTVFLGAVPATDSATPPTERSLTERVLRLLDMVGLDPQEVSDQLVVTPGCGLAGASKTWARAALDLCGRVAANVHG